MNSGSQVVKYLAVSGLRNKGALSTSRGAMEDYGWHNVRRIQAAAETNCAQKKCGMAGCLVCQGMKDIPKVWGEELGDIKETASELGRIVSEHDIMGSTRTISFKQ